MNGKLDPEERVMSSELSAYRKACAVMKSVSSDVTDTISKLGWDCYDDVVVEIGGTSVSGIDVGEEYNKKWQSPIGTRKYNKDAFIIIKNLSRSPFNPSQPFAEGEFKLSTHLKQKVMKPDMIVGWKEHLKKGHVWKANVELAMQDTPGDDIQFYDVEVYVVAPTQALATYIVATMYPDYESLCIDDEPTRTAP